MDHFDEDIPFTACLLEVFQQLQQDQTKSLFHILLYYITLLQMRKLVLAGVGLVTAFHQRGRKAILKNTTLFLRQIFPDNVSFHIYFLNLMKMFLKKHTYIYFNVIVLNDCLPRYISLQAAVATTYLHGAALKSLTTYIQVSGKVGRNFSLINKFPCSTA